MRPFPNVDEGRWQISSGGGDVPLWGRNGDELFYRRGDGAATEVLVVPVTTAPIFDPRTPTVLFEKPWGGGLTLGSLYDISSGGQRFPMVKPDEEARKQTTPVSGGIPSDKNVH